MAKFDSEALTTAPDGRPEIEQPQWRQDFPIAVPQDNYVARRDFTKFLILTSFAFTTGQLWILAKSWATPSKQQLPGIRIASVNQLAVGKSLVFAYPGEHDKCVLTRLDSDTFVAYSQACTHLSCAVIPQPEQGRLYCPCHEGAFDIASGNPIAGPPRRPLPRIKLDFQDGAIFATGLVSSSEEPQSF